jgi:hypothetical protein
MKSKVGLDTSELPRDISFCTYAILRSDFFVVDCNGPVKTDTGLRYLG